MSRHRPQLARLSGVDRRDRHGRDAAAAPPDLHEHLGFDFVAASPSAAAAAARRRERRGTRTACPAPGRRRTTTARGCRSGSRDSATPASDRARIAARRARRRRRSRPASARSAARLLRQMLHVAVEQQHVREVPLEHAREPGAHGVPLAAVRRRARSTSAPAARARSAVPSVDPSSTTMTRSTDGTQALDDVRDRARFVERRNQRRGAQRHRGRSADQQRRQHQHRRRRQRDDADRRDHADRAQRRIGRRDQRAVAEQRDRGRHENHRRELGVARAASPRS